MGDTVRGPAPPSACLYYKQQKLQKTHRLQTVEIGRDVELVHADQKNQKYQNQFVICLLKQVEQTKVNIINYHAVVTQACNEHLVAKEQKRTRD